MPRRHRLGLRASRDLLNPLGLNEQERAEAQDPRQQEPDACHRDEYGATAATDIRTCGLSRVLEVGHFLPIRVYRCLVIAFFFPSTKCMVS
jgi:hypothetical protein